MTVPGPERAGHRGPRTVLVLGATGAWGGSVARHLLAGGFSVRAFTRNPVSERARALRQAGGEPVAGDLADRPSLRAALAGCWGAFGRLPAGAPVEAGAVHGRNLVHALAASELEHCVLLLPEPAAEEAGLEGYARSLGLPATYLRLSGLAPDDLGPLVAEILARPGPYVGRTVTA